MEVYYGMDVDGKIHQTSSQLESQGAVAPKKFGAFFVAELHNKPTACWGFVPTSCLVTRLRTACGRLFLFRNKKPIINIFSQGDANV